MSCINHAKRELALIGYNVNPDPNSEDVNDFAVLSILELIDTFRKQGHSGFSANYVLNIFNKLARLETLSPLTGNDDEWTKVYSDENEISYMNNRDCRIFKHVDLKNKKEKCILLNHYVFVDKNNCSFSSEKSSIPIDKFPFTVPSEKYIYEGTEKAEKWIKKHNYNPFK